MALLWFSTEGKWRRSVASPPRFRNMLSFGCAHIAGRFARFAALTITMDRVDGSLDSRVVILDILDVNQKPIASDDDTGGHQNALLRFTVPTTRLIRCEGRPMLPPFALA